MCSGMRVVAIVRRAGLGLVYPPLRVGDELLAVGRVVANGSEGVERQREEVEHAHRIFCYVFPFCFAVIINDAGDDIRIVFCQPVFNLQRRRGDGPGTIVIYVDGRRLGLMFSQEDLDLGDGDIPPLPIWPLGFKWCGVLSAGAELRISGPKPPASG